MYSSQIVLYFLISNRFTKRESLTICLIFVLVRIEEVLLFFDLVSHHLRDLLFLESSVENDESLDHQRETPQVVEEAIEQLPKCFLRPDEFQVLPFHAIKDN